MQDVSPQRRMIMRNFERFLLKYVPYVNAIIFMGFCALRGCGGDNHHIAAFLGYAGILWAPYIFAASYAHGFCAWHRHLIWYDGLIGVLMYLESWHSFGTARICLNWTCFFIGLVLVGRVTQLIIKRKYCNDTNGKIPPGAAGDN